MGRPKKEAPNRSDGRYEVKITVGKGYDGKLIRKSFFSHISKADAKAKAEQYKINQVLEDVTGDIYNETPLFAKVANEFLELKKGTIKNNTFNFTYHIPATKYIIPYFGRKNISDIKKNDIELYLKKTKKDNNFSDETIRKHYICLNQIFNNAYQNGIINRNPCTGIKLHCIQKSSKKTYTQEEAMLVLEYCKYHRFGLDIHLMLSYGISRSELLGIRWQDVDMENSVISINQGVVEAKNPDTGKTEVIIGEPKNEFRRRVLPISDATIELLNQQRCIHPNAEYVICNQRGKVGMPSTWHERHYKPFMKEMAAYYESYDITVPMLNPHELRHTRTSIWVNTGANLYAVATVMGWADLKMLRKKYAHPDIEEIRKELA